MPGSFEHEVHRVIAALQPGDVVTYGEVAAEAGFPGAARAVGRVLATSDRSLPWWRVVTATGRLVPGNEAEHQRLLATEGIEVAGYRSADAFEGRVVLVGVRAAEENAR